MDKAVIDSGLKVSCSCELFLYYGLAYKAWKKGYGLIKETRPPRIRNPRLQGCLCHHLYATLSLYPAMAAKLERLLNQIDSNFFRIIL